MTGELRPNQGFVRSRFGGLPRGYWLLWAGTLVNRLGTMVQPFLAIYLHTVLGLGLAATGFEMAVFGSGQVISQLFGGWLTDLTGRVRTLAGSLFTSAAVMLFLGSVHGLFALTVGIFLLGVTIDAYRPASTALVADLVRPEDRVRAYGLLFWAVNLGFSAAMLLGGGLQDLGPRWLFLVNGLCTAAFGVVLVMGRVGDVAGPPPRHRGHPPERAAGGFREVLSDRVMVAYCLIALVYGVVYMQAFATLPLVMRADGMGSDSYGLAVAVNGIVIVLIQPLAGGWAAKRDHSAVFASGLVLLGLGFALGGLASSTFGYGLSVAIWSLGEIAVVSVGQAIVIALAPLHLRGRYSGLWGTAWGGAAAVVGPPLGTWLLGVGEAVLWTSCAALCVFAALAQWALRGEIMRRSAGSESTAMIDSVDERD